MGQHEELRERVWNTALRRIQMKDGQSSPLLWEVRQKTATQMYQMMETSFSTRMLATTPSLHQMIKKGNIRHSSAISHARQTARGTIRAKNRLRYAILSIKKKIFSKRVLQSSLASKKAGSGVCKNRKIDDIITKGGATNISATRGTEMIPKSSVLNSLNHTNMDQKEMSDILRTDTE